MEKPIAIIGGGPAGLYAAIRAAELGLRVVLYEKGKIGRGISCAEGFIDTLGILGRPEAGVLFRVERAIFLVGREYHMHLPEACGLWMIDRSAWQKALGKRAEQMGVSIKEDFPVAKNQLLKMLDTYKYIVDASGAPSVTSRIYRFVPLYLRNAALLAQYVVEGDFGHLGNNTIKVGFQNHDKGGHYWYWIFPKGQNIANVGVGRFNTDKRYGDFYLRDRLDRVLKEEELGRYEILRKISSFCPSNGVPKLVWGDVLLAGDAAALSSPLHGAGMDMACISGRMAAEAIASRQVQHYPSRLWNIVGKKLTMEKRVVNLWHRFGNSFLSGVLKFPWLLAGIFFNRPPITPILGFGGRIRW
jgi:digeranylgeranylglycerophospholipid reductase